MRGGEQEREGGRESEKEAVTWKGMRDAAILER
jgi:hypothetical protein